MAYLSERKVCPCVKWVSVTSRLSCRVFNLHCGTSEHSAFGEIRFSDEFRLRLNFDLGRALFLIFYMNQIRNFSYYFLVKILFHHNISYHPIDINPFVWIEPVAYLSERKVCPCVKWVSVTSRLSCRVFNPHCETSEHSAFGEIRFSDEFGLRLNFDLGRALFLVFYMNQIRKFSCCFLVEILFHHNISYHTIDKKFFKISFFPLRGKKHLQNWASPAA